MSHFSLLRRCLFLVMAVMLPVWGVAQDAGVKTILQPTATVCGGDLLPVVIVTNYGTADLTYFRINYELDGSVLANYSWIGSLQTGETDTLIFPPLNLGLGLYTLRVFTSDPNFMADLNPANDTLARTFEVTESIGLAPPFFADFDDPDFPYDGFIVNNPDGEIGWQRTDSVTFSGAGALYMNNYDYNGIGQEDEFTLPGINLTKLDRAGLSFMVSYAQYGVNSGFADTLEVYVSGDCGVTFDRVYQKYGAELATAPPTTSAFFPRGSWDWRQEWVDLSAYFEATFLVVRFRHVSNYENNLFLDRIGVEKIFALDAEAELNQQAVITTHLDPGSSVLAVEVRSGNGKTGRASFVMMDIHGREVYRESVNVSTAVRDIQVPVSSVPAGVYYLQLTGDFMASEPVILR